jgi:hypothetical protein
VCCEPTNVLLSFSFMHPAAVGVRCKYIESGCSLMSLVALFVELCYEFISDEFGAQFVSQACVCLCVCGLLSVSYNVLYSQ